MIEFEVGDMSCGHCVASITRAAKEVDAGARCEVDLVAKRVRIESVHPATEFSAAIEEAGFTPKLASGG